MLIKAQGGSERRVFEGGRLKLEAWDDQQTLYALDTQGVITRLVRIAVTSGKADTIWQTERTVESFRASPDGRLVVAAVRAPAGESEAGKTSEGVVFDYGRDTFEALLARHHTEFIEIMVIDMSGGVARLAARLPYQGFDHPARNYVENITVAPDGTKAALSLVKPGKPAAGGAPNNLDLGIVNLTDGRWEEVAGSSVWSEVAATWLGDSSRLFLFSNGEGKIYHTGSKTMAVLPWAKLRSPNDARAGGRYDKPADRLGFPHRQGLGWVSFKEQRLDVQEGLAGNVSYSADGNTSAFVSESIELRPEVAVHDFRSGVMKRITNLNAYLDQRAVSRVEKLTIKNTYGREATGYLHYPVGYQAGQRYPLLLASYGFRGRYQLTAEWHTTFPVETLAGMGYSVLLLNLPSGLQGAQQLAGDPTQARENEGWQTLSTFESAVRFLVQSGVADPDKVGLYGWSHGVFVVEFILAHSKLPFSAACVGEGGDYNPGGYWFWGGKTWPAIFRNLYGGALSAETAPAYLEFAPALNADKVRTPVLLEYASVYRANLGAEFYTPLRERGVPAELVIYENERHNFVRPTTRFASMHRKVDWFNYWMLGKKDSDPAKAAQYARWDKMKAEWEARKGENPPSPKPGK